MTCALTYSSHSFPSLLIPHQPPPMLDTNATEFLQLCSLQGCHCSRCGSAGYLSVIPWRCQVIRLYSVDDQQTSIEYCWNNTERKRTKCSGKKSVPVSLFPPKIPRRLNWEWIHFSEVRERRWTAWATGWTNLFLCILILFNFFCLLYDHQCGFRRNRSTTDHLFCIRQMLGEKWEYNEAVHQLFIDFKKTYDSVRREVLYNILTEFGILEKLIRLIKMCLTETYSRVRVGKNLLTCFLLGMVWK